MCIDLYREILRLRPTLRDVDDNASIEIVIAGTASDPPDWQAHVRGKAGHETLAKRFRDANDPLMMVLVCDMWQTGFDVPCLHTMYVDKPMRGRHLMQAIARVNRVFKDKPGGLIVDYVGLAHELKRAERDLRRERRRRRDGARAVGNGGGLAREVRRLPWNCSRASTGRRGQPGQRPDASGCCLKHRNTSWPRVPTPTTPATITVSTVRRERSAFCAPRASCPGHTRCQYRTSTLSESATTSASFRPSQPLCTSVRRATPSRRKTWTPPCAPSSRVR